VREYCAVMSRAFVKEQDGDTPDDGLPELPVSSAPNHVTPEGLADLQARLAAALADVDALRSSAEKASAKSALTRAKADVRRLQRRLDTAVLIKPDAGGDDAVTLGARVTIEHSDGKCQTYTIVGEDQADPVNGLVSWTSPLGEALLGKRSGERTTWRRPAGEIEITIVETIRTH
jgi:transcription elongation factor GreB